MSLVTIEVDIKEYDRFVATVHRGASQFIRISSEVLRRAMKLGEQYAKVNLSGKKLFARTGSLRASVKGDVIVEGKTTVIGRLGLLVPKNAKVPIYGTAQEEGAEASVPKGRAMTIPLPAALTPAGVPRFTANEARGLFAATFWRKDVLFGRKRGGGLVPLFAASRYVKIGGGPGKGVRFLQEARDELIEPTMKELSEKLADLFDLRKKKGQ